MSVNRKTVQYVPRFDRFVLSAKDYSQQYNGVYLARLAQMRASLRAVAVKKWGSQSPILAKVIDIESEHEKNADDREYILIGTLYKDMSLRGSVLDEFKENNGISGAVQSLYHIASKEDSLVLEDESGRIALGGARMLAQVGQLVTGVVVAVKGSVDDNGVMNVADWVFMHTLQSLPSSSSPSSTTGTTACATAVDSSSTLALPVPTADSKYLLLVSGLHIGNPPPVQDPAAAPVVGASELSAQLLMDFVAGRLTGNAAHIDLASRIARVIVAGDSVAPASEGAKDRHSSYKAQRLAVSPSKQLDVLLAQLLTVCHVDIMPGEVDPSNLTLPQQPLHPCLFPHSSRFSSLQRVTNPYEASFDGVTVLGHSGQPVTDIARQRLDCMPSAKAAVKADPVPETDAMDVESAALSLEAGRDAGEVLGGATLAERLQRRGCCGEQSVGILQDTLSWGHLCPTSPDTLACYPFLDADPFIVPETRIPQLLFTGNQSEYATRLVSVDDHSNGSTTSSTTSTTSSTAPVVRLVSVPCFATTGIAVLVDISTSELRTFPVHFR